MLGECTPQQTLMVFFITFGAPLQRGGPVTPKVIGVESGKGIWGIRTTGSQIRYYANLGKLVGTSGETNQLEYCFHLWASKVRPIFRDHHKREVAPVHLHCKPSSEVKK